MKRSPVQPYRSDAAGLQNVQALKPQSGHFPWRFARNSPFEDASLTAPEQRSPTNWTTMKRLFSCLLALASNVGVCCADNSVENADLSAIWNDPTFQKQFVGGYGINAEIEPRVTPEEVKLLEKVRPLMANDLPKAEALLTKEINPKSSAVLDYTLGGIQFQQDKMADALGSFEKAAAKFPSFRRAYRNIGLINVKDGKYDESIKAFTKMIELGGGDAYSYGLLGFAYAAKQDFQAAEAS